MVRHVFVWKMADGYERSQVTGLLEQLSRQISYIADWDMGTHAGEPNENGDPWDGALVTDFESWDDLDRYSNDPLHADIVSKLLPMVASRAVVDWERS
jgi:hypothetical protein